MQRVHAGHDEVDGVEDVRFRREVRAWLQVLRDGWKYFPEQSSFELVVVFEVLDDQEDERARDRDDQVGRRLVALSDCAERTRARPSASSPGARACGRPHRAIELRGRLREDFGVPAPVDRVGNEEPTEEEELLRQERPHPQLRRVEC